MAEKTRVTADLWELYPTAQPFHDAGSPSLSLLSYQLATAIAPPLRGLSELNEISRDSQVHGSAKASCVNGN